MEPPRAFGPQYLTDFTTDYLTYLSDKQRGHKTTRHYTKPPPT
jgi:hypothetical protein